MLANLLPLKNQLQFRLLIGAVAPNLVVKAMALVSLGFSACICRYSKNLHHPPTRHQQVVFFAPPRSLDKKDSEA